MNSGPHAQRSSITDRELGLHKSEARRLIKNLGARVLVLRLKDLWFNILEPTSVFVSVVTKELPRDTYCTRTFR